MARWLLCHIYVYQEDSDALVLLSRFMHICIVELNSMLLLLLSPNLLFLPFGHLPKPVAVPCTLAANLAMSFAIESGAPFIVDRYSMHTAAGGSKRISRARDFHIDST